MPAKNVPCSVCGEPMWKSPDLAAVPCCRNCRRRLPRAEKESLGIVAPRRKPTPPARPARSRTIIGEKLRRWQRDSSALGLTLASRYELLHEWQSRKVVCLYCGMHAADTVDHIVPLARGGSNFSSNLAPACRSCNSSKGTKLLAEWMPSMVHLSNRRPIVQLSLW